MTSSELTPGSIKVSQFCCLLPDPASPCSRDSHFPGWTVVQTGQAPWAFPSHVVRLWSFINLSRWGQGWGAYSGEGTQGTHFPLAPGPGWLRKGLQKSRDHPILQPIEQASQSSQGGRPGETSSLPLGRCSVLRKSAVCCERKTQTWGLGTWVNIRPVTAPPSRSWLDRIWQQTALFQRLSV